VGLDIGIGGGPRLTRFSFAVGDVGEVVSRLICPGLLGGRGGAVPTMGKPSLLCGRTPSLSGNRLVGNDLSSSKSSPGLNGLSIRGGGGAPERATHLLERATARERKQAYALKEKVVHHVQLAPGGVVLELLLRLAEVEVALLVLCSVVSFVLGQPLCC
jgi:hypothetical protein